METLELIKDWSFKSIWNEASLRQEREPKARDYAYCSELGKPLIDRFLSMKGVAPSNPPNMRSKRKFLFGDIVEEFANIILSLLGVTVKRQEVVCIEGIIPIHGKIDFVIEGIPNYEMARHGVRQLNFSEGITDYLLSVVDKFEEKIGHRELAPIIRECKSVSQYAIDAVSENGGMLHHKLQVYPYLKGTDIKIAYIDYISKADSLMEECRVSYPDPRLEDRIGKDLEELNYYLKNNEQPPPAPLITWEGKFKKSFFVEWSNYLELVYGFKTPEDYRKAVQGKIASWNRTLARLKMINEGAKTKPSKKFPEGQLIKLTDKNLDAVTEMDKEGWDAYALSAKAKIELDEEEND